MYGAMVVRPLVMRARLWPTQVAGEERAGRGAAWTTLGLAGQAKWKALASWLHPSKPEQSHPVFVWNRASMTRCPRDACEAVSANANQPDNEHEAMAIRPHLSVLVRSGLNERGTPWLPLFAHSA